MRIIHLAGYGGPYSGSFVPVLRAVLRASRARGWQAEVGFAPVAKGREWLSDLEADGIQPRFAPPSRGASKEWLRRWVDEYEGPTILHTHFTAFDVPAVQIARSHPNAVVFWHIHSPLLPGLAVRARNIVKFRMYGRRVERILCVSPQLAESVKRRLAPSKKVMVFANAIDTDRFPASFPEQRSAARAELGLPDDSLILLHLGWDWQRKGGDVFLRAFRLLRDSWRTNILAITVGGRADARALGNELGLGDTLLVLEPVEQIQKLYAAADLFVAPSRAEGTPYAVAEALCSGLPVAASDIPPHAPMGSELASCQLAALEPEALASAIGSLLSRDPETAEAEARRARAWVVEHMDLRGWVERLISLYERTFADLHE